MITGLTTDMPAVPGQADTKPTARPSGHGSDFARVLAGQSAALREKAGAYPDRGASDAQQDDDTGHAQPDVPDAKLPDADEFNEAASPTHHIPPEGRETDISTRTGGAELVQPVAPQNPHSHTTPPPQHAGDTAAAGHPAGATIDAAAPAQGDVPRVATSGTGKTKPPHIAQLSLLAANTPSVAATEQTGARQSQAVATAFYDDTSELPETGPLLLNAAPDPDRQFAMTGAAWGTSPANMPTGLPVNVTVALPKTPPSSGLLRGLLDTTADARTPAPSESYAALQPTGAALMRPPPAGWTHEMAATLQYAGPENAVPELPSTAIETPPIAAPDGTGNHITRAPMPLLRNDAAFSASLAQAIQTAADTGKSVFELDILEGTGGKMRVSIFAMDGSVQVSILAGRADMLDMLKRSLNLLAADLTALGFTDVDLHLGNQGGNGAAHHLHISSSATANAPEQNTEPPQGILSTQGAGMDLRL